MSITNASVAMASIAFRITFIATYLGTKLRCFPEIPKRKARNNEILRNFALLTTDNTRKYDTHPHDEKVFVPFALLHEIVEIQIIVAKKNFALGKVINILQKRKLT